MKTLLKIIFLIIVMYVISMIGFWFEDYFQKFVRFLYSYFTNGQLTFRREKYFYFPSAYFIISFCVFWIFIFLLFRKVNLKKMLFYISILLSIFILTVIIYSAIESKGFLGEKTNEMEISRRDIKYDQIFILSAFISIISGMLLRKKASR